MSLAKDLRAYLNPLAAVRASRPLYDTAPQPGGAVKPVAFTDPATMPVAVQTTNPDGSTGIDLAAQIALVQAGLAQFGDLRIRTITGSTTLGLLQSLTWLTGVPQDVPVSWSSTPLAPVQGAVARLDASIAATGRVTGVVLDESVTDKGCTVRCTAVGAAPVTINTALPLTVVAVGLYLYWPPYQGGS